MSYTVNLNSSTSVEARTASGLGTGSLLIARASGPGQVWASPQSDFSTGVVEIPSSPDVVWPSVVPLYLRGWGRVVLGVSTQDVYDKPFVSRALSGADDGAVFVCTTVQTATVNKDLPLAFGCSFSGPVSFAGTAAVVDKRTAGDADPICSLVQVGVDSYKAVGSKV